MLRSLIALSVVLALAVSGLAAAAATAHGPVTEMVVCGGEGPETIRIDARGNPVKGSGCCDCLQCLVADAALPGGAAAHGVRASLARAEPRLPAACLPEAARYSRPIPRGPPVADIAVCVLSEQDAH